MMSFDNATILRPVTINSRAIIIMAIQAGIVSVSTSNIKAEITSSLSAMGSSSMPSFVTCPVFLATYPSSRSVREAILKSTAPSRGLSEATRIKGRIINILLRVIIVGMLIKGFP
jgi:hypothetical protein